MDKWPKTWNTSHSCCSGCIRVFEYKIKYDKTTRWIDWVGPILDGLGILACVAHLSVLIVVTFRREKFRYDGHKYFEKQRRKNEVTLKWDEWYVAPKYFKGGGNKCSGKYLSGHRGQPSLYLLLGWLGGIAGWPCWMTLLAWLAGWACWLL